MHVFNNNTYIKIYVIAANIILMCDNEFIEHINHKFTYGIELNGERFEELITSSGWSVNKYLWKKKPSVWLNRPFLFTAHSLWWRLAISFHGVIDCKLARSFRVLFFFLGCDGDKSFSSNLYNTETRFQTLHTKNNINLELCPYMAISKMKCRITVNCTSIAWCFYFFFSFCNTFVQH